MLIHNRGNILFIILLAVLLFAALANAVLQVMRGDGKNASDEGAQLTQAVLDGYITNVQVGLIRLEFRGCQTVDFTEPVNQVSGDKSCHLFHPGGAGVIFQDLGLDDCELSGIDRTTLAVGETCGSLIFAGTSGGNRLYTIAAHASSHAGFKATPYVTTGATSSTDGLSNTNILITFPGHTAANLCRALGEDWYLPASSELATMINNRNNGALISIFGSPDSYWSSTEVAFHAASRVSNTGSLNISVTKNGNTGVHCVRR